MSFNLSVVPVLSSCLSFLSVCRYSSLMSEARKSLPYNWNYNSARDNIATQWNTRQTDTNSWIDRQPHKLVVWQAKQTRESRSDNKEIFRPLRKLIMTDTPTIRRRTDQPTNRLPNRRTDRFTDRYAWQYIYICIYIYIYIIPGKKSVSNDAKTWITTHEWEKDEAQKRNSYDSLLQSIWGHFPFILRRYSRFFVVGYRLFSRYDRYIDI